MIVYTLLLVTLLIAFISIFLLWRGRNSVGSDKIARVFLCLSLAIFIYLYGAWVFLSIYTKYIFALCFVIALIGVLLSGKPDSATKSGSVITNLFFTGLFSVLCILYFAGTTGRPPGIANLAFPLKEGDYFVFQGGKGLPTNIFHYGFRGAVFAIDIVKLNKFGNRAKKIFSSRLGDYEIFGDTIYSPCSGVVLAAKSENPDNTPPNRERGPSNTNQVLIESDSFYVFMGHMKQGAVFVKEGDSVSQGQPLGCVGNSGFSLEPHLHIQVHARTNKGLPWYKEKQVLITFNGKSYLLFEEILAR